jgi:NADH-quinone oxidoreductase subunit L
MSLATTIALIPLLPLAGFVLLGLWGKKTRSAGGIIGTLLMAASTALALYVALDYFIHPVNGVYQQTVPLQITWLRFTDSLSIDMGILLDPVSAMMLVVVTFVSLMVHLYSLAYMKGEARFGTYYAFLSLFTFSMLGLVLSSNLFQVYFFWELVGVSSFLLIGYYYNRPSAVAAAKKAFIVTRFADLGFLIGILIFSFEAGTLDFTSLISRLTGTSGPGIGSATATAFLGISALSWGAALIFIGGAGKSAMFPLHIWLPDAMEGPTPVSALIHAATMVVAGVFLVARLFPVFAITTPAVLEIVGWVGAISAIIAAIIACTQTDIKRVLAYSTMSQIGFMMFALGVSGYGPGQQTGFTASMFHLFTHALFKALLFLGAGAVIHFVHSNEMKDMGGLRKVMPITHITFLVACLAISGVPPFAGFFSKEEILLAAYHGNTAIYFIGLITSALTAFYMFRLYFMIFWNKPFTPGHAQHGEGGWMMMLPLLLLSVGAAAAGFIPFGKFVTADGRPLAGHFDIAFSIAPVSLAVAGIIIAALLFKRQSTRAGKIAMSLGGIYRAAYHKFYIDEIYLFLTRKIIFNLVGKPAAWFDRNVVDGLVNFTGKSTEKISAAIKNLQSGKVQAYAFYFLAGALGLAALFIYILK